MKRSLRRELPQYGGGARLRDKCPGLRARTSPYLRVACKDYRIADILRQLNGASSGEYARSTWTWSSRSSGEKRSGAVGTSIDPLPPP
ncbi:MAG: hypothetical protein ACUVTL_08095 [Thermoproteota archaeon]